MAIILLILIIISCVNYNTIFLLLINYHIYCIYVLIAVSSLLTSYTVYINFQYFYLTAYVYTYWFIYINSFLINFTLLSYYCIYIYDFLVF